jgi:hypothetical protein
MSDTATEQAIWPGGKKLRIIGGTGPFGSGKSIFGLGICPASTLVIDNEKSCEDYETLGFTRIDIPELLHKKYKQRYTERQKYDLFASLLNRVPAGKYSVGMIDTLDEIEGGLVESIKARYASFGYKSSEKFESTGGIFWKHVNAELERLLLDAAARFQTLYFTTHLRKVWKWGKPTDSQEPRGKEVLMKLASLYLQFESNGAGKPPSAKVLKGRTSSPELVDGVLQVNAFLPDRLPVATAAAIRQYILNPPDFANLKDEELVKEKELTDGDRVLINAKLAEDQRAAAEAQANAAASRERTEALKAEVLEKIAEKEARKRTTTVTTETEAAKEEPREQQPTDGSSGKVIKVNHVSEVKEMKFGDGTPREKTVTLVKDARIGGFMDDVRKLDMETKVLDAIVSVLAKRGVTVASADHAPALLTKEEFGKFRARVDSLLNTEGK